MFSSNCDTIEELFPCIWEALSSTYFWHYSRFPNGNISQDFSNVVQVCQFLVTVIAKVQVKPRFKQGNNVTVLWVKKNQIWSVAGSPAGRQSLLVNPRNIFWGQYCSTFSLITWTMSKKQLLASVSATENRQKCLAGQVVVPSFRWTSADGWNGSWS